MPLGSWGQLWDAALVTSRPQRMPLVSWGQLGEAKFRGGKVCNFEITKDATGELGAALGDKVGNLEAPTDATVELGAKLGGAKFATSIQKLMFGVDAGMMLFARPFLSRCRGGGPASRP